MVQAKNVQVTYLSMHVGCASHSLPKLYIETIPLRSKIPVSTYVLYWDVTLFLTNAYGLLFTSGDGNHEWNIEFITSGRRPRVIISIFHKWLPSPRVNNNPYAWVKNRVTTLIYPRWLSKNSPCIT